MSMTDYIQEVKQRYELWWTDRNENPVVYCIFPAGGDFQEKVRDWMAPKSVGGWTAWRQEFLFGQAVELAAQTGDFNYVDEAADLLERYADITDRMAEGYHFLFVNMGASMMSALLTGETKFNGDTIWLEMEQELTLDEILEFDESTESDYARAALEAMRRFTRRLEGRFVFGIPELGGLLDILAAMRKTNNLLLDTMDAPEKLDQAVALMERLWWHWYGRFSEIVDPANPGCYTQAMRILSARPSNIATCDFSAMISPDAFARWVLPGIRRETEKFDGRVVYHLDGPGELPHVDHLLSLDKLHGIQWVPGAGNPGGLDESYDDLYRRILDAGKKICLSGAGNDPDRLAAFFSKWPAREFFIPVTARDRSHGEKLLAACKG
jgi:5-methyltetrahydrofolate--homocysteine methyltransferase